MPFHLSLFLSRVLDFGAHCSGCPAVQPLLVALPWQSNFRSRGIPTFTATFGALYSRVFNRAVCKQRRHCGLVFRHLLRLADFFEIFFGALKQLSLPAPEFLHFK